VAGGGGAHGGDAIERGRAVGDRDGRGCGRGGAGVGRAGDQRERRPCRCPRPARRDWAQTRDLRTVADAGWGRWHRTGDERVIEAVDGRAADACQAAVSAMRESPVRVRVMLAPGFVAGLVARRPSVAATLTSGEIGPERDVVNLDEGDARGVADAADLDGVAAGGEIAEHGGVAACRAGKRVAGEVGAGAGDARRRGGRRRRWRPVRGCPSRRWRRTVTPLPGIGDGEGRIGEGAGCIAGRRGERRTGGARDQGLFGGASARRRRGVDARGL